MNSPTLSSKGQGLIETLLTLPIAAALLASLIALAYRAALFSYADHQLHEALLCTDDSAPRSCEKNLHSQLRRMLLFQESLEVRIAKTSSKTTGTIRIQKNQVSNIYYKIWPALKLEKEMTFPLKVR